MGLTGTLSDVRPPEIMVSVAMATYNHEKYIGQAIESVLMQKVNFKYELVIAEDCSTDNTRQIVIKYKKEYPDRIVLLLQKANVGMDKNGYQMMEACKGKYIAFLEGDDYWTDENKLQKQVDFLEKNTSYSAVYHNVTTIGGNNQIRVGKWKGFPNYDEHTVDAKKHIQGRLLIGQLGSLVCVNFWKNWSSKEKRYYYHCRATGDHKLFIELLFQGDVFFMSDTMSAYRKIIHGGDSWSARTNGKNMSGYHYFKNKSLMQYAYRRGGFEIDMALLRRLVEGSVKLAIETTTKENIAIARECLYDYLLFVMKRKFDKLCHPAWKK